VQGWYPKMCSLVCCCILRLPFQGCRSGRCHSCGKLNAAILAAYNYGVLMGILASKPAVCVSEVPATQWKAKMRLRGRSKDDSRLVAQQLFPFLSHELRYASLLHIELTHTMTGLPELFLRDECQQRAECFP
jgi:hypothetical protein